MGIAAESCDHSSRRHGSARNIGSRTFRDEADVRRIASLRAVVPKLTFQFVFAVVIWLFLGSAGPLFAGVICFPPGPEAIDNLSDDYSFQVWPARSGDIGVAEKTVAINDASGLTLRPRVPQTHVAQRDGFLALLAGSCDGPASREPLANWGLPVQRPSQGPQPTAPLPEKPPGSGDYGATGGVPRDTPTDQRLAIATASAATARETEGEACVWYLPPASETHASRQFRPPRQG
jgi:hypothetical protein